MKTRKTQGESAMNLENIPPYFVSLFPNTEGIRKDVLVRLIRDSAKKAYRVENILIPNSFLRDEEAIKSNNFAIWATKGKGIWIYYIRVEIWELGSENHRLIHPSCLCLLD